MQKVYVLGAKVGEDIAETKEEDKLLTRQTLTNLGA